MLECESFLSYVFNDGCFPPKCNDRIKIETFPSDIKLLSACLYVGGFWFTFCSSNG